MTAVSLQRSHPSTIRDQVLKGWQLAKLADLVIDARAGFAAGQRDASGIVQLRMNNVTTSGTLDWSSFIRVPADKETATFYALQPGDVLFNNTNSTEMVGKTALFEGFPEPVVFSNHFTRIRTAPALLDPAFLSLWLLSLWKRGTFAQLCDRWIGQSAVQRSKLLALELAFPPISEQRRIAAALREQLAEVAKARAAAESQLIATQSLFDSLVRETLTGPQSEKWSRQDLQACATLQRGRFSPRPRNDPTFYGGTHPFIQTGDVDSADGYIRTHTQTLNERGFAVSKLFQANTLVITIAANIGLVGMLAFDCCMTDSLVGIQGKPDIADNRFLFFTLKTQRSALLALAPQMAQANLSLALLGPSKIRLPNIATQKRLAKYLDEAWKDIRILRSAIESQIAEIEATKVALLREAFSRDISPSS